MFQFFFFFVSLLFLAAASYTDLRQRIVPNKLNYGMLLLGIFGHAIWAFFANDLAIIFFCIAATIIAFAFSIVFWKLGVWAGGDVKLFAALAALNPINPNILAYLGFSFEFFKAIQLPVFPITVFVFSVFAMLPYGAIISIARLKKNKEVKKEFLRDLKKKFFSALEYSFFLAGLYHLLVFFEIPILLELPLLFLFGLLKRKKPRIGIAIALFAFALYTNWQSSLQWLAEIFFVLLGGFLLFRLYFLSKKLMRKKILVEELEEGMIVSETLLENNGIIAKAPEIEIKKIINYLRANRLQDLADLLNPKGRAIASSRAAAGLEPEQIKELKKLAMEKKIESAISIRESAPFVPAVLIAYAILNVVGDLLWNWIFLL